MGTIQRKSKKASKRHFNAKQTISKAGKKIPCFYKKPNPFNKPEAFQVVIMAEMSNVLCSECSFIDENWNNIIELTQENIKLIINQLMEQKE